jgi:heme-degrading monooxygenase HmoA
LPRAIGGTSPPPASLAVPLAADASGTDPELPVAPALAPLPDDEPDVAPADAPVEDPAEGIVTEPDEGDPEAAPDVVVPADPVEPELLAPAEAPLPLGPGVPLVAPGPPEDEQPASAQVIAAALPAARSLRLTIMRIHLPRASLTRYPAPSHHPGAAMILFQLYFEVDESKRAEFERAFAEVFKPALSRQPGFQNVKFLRIFSPTAAAAIEAAPTEFNYQVNFVFDDEPSRRRWSKSPDHDVAWPTFSGLAKKAAWRGYDIVG